MKKNVTRFLLAFLVLGFGIQSCKKSDANFKADETYFEIPQNKQNEILEELAKTVAKTMSNKDFRVIVKKEALKKVDGDYDIHYADLAKKSINEFAISDVMESNVSFGKKGISGINSFNKLSETVPNFQLSVPVNIKKWDTEEYEPLVTYMPVGINDVDVEEMRAFDSKGNLHILDGQSPPDFPVIVVGSSERRDENGEILAQFVTDSKRMIQPIDDEGGSGGGSGGGSTNYHYCDRAYNTSKHDYVTYAKFKSLDHKRSVEAWALGDAEMYHSIVFATNVSSELGFDGIRKGVHTTWGSTNWLGHYSVTEQYLNIQNILWNRSYYGDRIKYVWMEQDGGNWGTISVNLDVKLLGASLGSIKYELPIQNNDDRAGESIVEWTHVNNTNSKGYYYDTGTLYFYVRQK